MDREEIDFYVRLFSEVDCSDGDKEMAHVTADALLLQCVPAEIRDAYHALNERAGGFWYA